MHKYKLTKCPSVHGMTALGWCLPLHSSDKHKYANTKEQKCKKYKHKNTQIKTDKMSFRAWYDSPWSLPAFTFLSSSRPSHSRAAGRSKTRKDFQRFNRSRTINSFLTESSWDKQLSNRINVISTILQLKDQYQSTNKVKEKETQTISDQDSSIKTA